MKITSNKSINVKKNFHVKLFVTKAAIITKMILLRSTLTLWRRAAKEIAAF